MTEEKLGYNPILEGRGRPGAATNAENMKGRIGPSRSCNPLWHRDLGNEAGAGRPTAECCILQLVSQIAIVGAALCRYRRISVGTDANWSLDRRRPETRKPQRKAKSLRLNGRGGIRTHGTLLTYTHFPGVRLKPLGHPSNHTDCGQLGSAPNSDVVLNGQGEIRTLDTGFTGMPVFETGAFNHSATCPAASQLTGRPNLLQLSGV